MSTQEYLLQLLETCNLEMRSRAQESTAKTPKVLPSVACHQNTFWKGAEGSAAKSKPSLQLSCSENQWGFGIPRYRDSGLQTLLYNQSQIHSFQMLQNRDSALYY